MKKKIKYMTHNNGNVRELSKILYIQSLFAGRFKEGDKVKLAYERMVTSPDWSAKTDIFKNWCEQYKDMELTVEYDMDKKDKPSVVCLVEDISKPKWLFSTMDLSPIDGDETEFLIMLKWATKK